MIGGPRPPPTEPWPDWKHKHWAFNRGEWQHLPATKNKEKQNKQTLTRPTPGGIGPTCSCVLREKFSMCYNVNVTIDALHGRGNEVGWNKNRLRRLKEKGEKRRQRERMWCFSGTGW